MCVCVSECGRLMESDVYIFTFLSCPVPMLMRLLSQLHRACQTNLDVLPLLVKSLPGNILEKRGVGHRASPGTS